jgi:hypothetical protein
MHSLTDFILRTPFHWWIVLISCAVGLAAICTRALQTEESRARHTEQKKKKELRSLAERISVYGRSFNATRPEMSSSASET